ncbi:MAG: hypothetical protein IJV64_03970 [Oscillospiraceae bacterium]|nr:hypothetical protein [Oscillospiraceae bacterium]
MENGNGIQPVMNVGGYGSGDGFGMNGWGGIIGLLAVLGLANGGFGFGGNRNGGNDALAAAILASNNNGFANAIGYENLATQSQVDRGFDNQNSMANQREILSAVTNGTAQAVAATNNTFHDTLAVLNDKYAELQRDIAANAVSLANVQANQNQCCCETKLLISETGAGINAGIAQNRYEAAMNTAAINANTTAQTQRILDAISQDKIESLQAQVAQLQLQNQLAGVVRYPMNTMYGVPSPCFNGCGCGCGNGFAA